MKTALFIGFSAVLLLGALLYAATGSRMAVNRGEIQKECLADVTAAQEASFDAICTQEIRLLLCAKDPSFTYEASNGCEIGFLVERGWK